MVVVLVLAKAAYQDFRKAAGQVAAKAADQDFSKAAGQVAAKAVDQDFSKPVGQAAADQDLSKMTVLVSAKGSAPVISKAQEDLTWVDNPLDSPINSNWVLDHSSLRRLSLEVECSLVDLLNSNSPSEAEAGEEEVEQGLGVRSEVELLLIVAPVSLLASKPNFQLRLFPRQSSPMFS